MMAKMNNLLVRGTDLKKTAMAQSTAPSHAPSSLHDGDIEFVFGGMPFHFMENYTVVKFGLLESLERAQTYAFYCAVLVTGIVISQLRTRKPDPDAGWLRRQFFPSLGVAVFFCFLSFFDGPPSPVEPAPRRERSSKSVRTLVSSCSSCSTVISRSCAAFCILCLPELPLAGPTEPT